jgi:hypothetical protein
MLVLKSMGGGQISSIYIRWETPIRIQNSRCTFTGLYTSANAGKCLKCQFTFAETLEYLLKPVESINYKGVIRFPVFKL